MWGESEFNSTFSSPSTNAAKDNKKNLIRHIVPVNGQIIHQATQVEGENSVFEFRHLRFHQVSFIGIIRNVIKRTNDITYLIDDMTSAEINVKLQSEDADDMESEESHVQQSQNQFIENQYVKVFGIIKSLGGVKNVQAFKIIPIKELNEVTHHILEVMNASVHLSTKGSGTGDSGMGMDQSMQSGNYNKGNANPTSFSSFGGNLNDQIENFIKACKSSQGYHIREICDAFKNVSEAKIRTALDFLSTEGHVYSTVDDEHFKSTDTM